MKYLLLVVFVLFGTVAANAQQPQEAPTWLDYCGGFAAEFRADAEKGSYAEVIHWGNAQSLTTVLLGDWGNFPQIYIAGSVRFCQRKVVLDLWTGWPDFDWMLLELEVKPIKKAPALAKGL